MEASEQDREGQHIAGGGWQPAETAPENVAILVAVPWNDYYGNGGVYAAMRVNMGTGRRWMTFGWACGRDLTGNYQPSHWMPIPAPPLNPAAATAVPRNAAVGTDESTGEQP